MKIDSVSSGLSQSISSNGNDISVQGIESVEAVTTENIARETDHAAVVQELDDMNDVMVDKAIEQANKSLAVYDKRIERVVHDVTKTVMYTVKDTKTNEVIREFPPKKIQDMIAKMWELAGLFVDEKA